MMIVFFIILLLVLVVGGVFLAQPKFGKIPSGESLERIRQSPNYKDGKFQNLSVTPDLTEGVTYYSVLKEFIFSKKDRVRPADTIPSRKTRFDEIAHNDDVLIWFGHSSYYLQLDGKRILVDPVFSGAASPVPATTRSFAGTDIYEAHELPEIDFLLITHDHWDHLDYRTVTQLMPKVGVVLCGLGVGEHLKYWGYDAKMIREFDWNDSLDLGSGFRIHATPARHFSGRGILRNKSLWLSFVLQTPSHRVYVGGDSGYDSHFTDIGQRFGPFDLAILENGQYDKSWKYIHLMPDEVVRAAKDLGARKFMAVHSSKFALGNHSWDEPLTRVSEIAAREGMPIVTPMIGERVDLNDSLQQFKQWWKGVR